MNQPLKSSQIKQMKNGQFYPNSFPNRQKRRSINNIRKGYKAPVASNHSLYSGQQRYWFLEFKK